MNVIIKIYTLYHLYKLYNNKIYYKGEIQMAIWELEQDSSAHSILSELICNYHSHLEEAKIVIYCSDKNKVRANKIVIADASKAPAKLKASINADFTITLYMMPWGDLNTSQKRACLDHELYHCGVHYEPVKEQVGQSRQGRPRMQVVRDEYGRVQYTNEIKRDVNGEPKWRLIPHDLEEFDEIVERHGRWDESIQSFSEALNRSSSQEENVSQNNGE